MKKKNYMYIGGKWKQKEINGNLQKLKSLIQYILKLNLSQIQGGHAHSAGIYDFFVFFK